MAQSPITRSFKILCQTSVKIAKGNEEPGTSKPLEKLSSPSSSILTTPDRLEEYSSPVIELLENLSPIKSSDYVTDSSEDGSIIVAAKDCKKKNPPTVTVMAKTDFLGTSKVEKMIINRKRGINKECINWLQTRETYLKRDSPNSIYFKKGKPVSTAKLTDIQSILHLIPQDAQPFYNGLICDDAIEDDIDGLDALDFEIVFDDNLK